MDYLQPFKRTQEYWNYKEWVYDFTEKSKEKVDNDTMLIEKVWEEEHHIKMKFNRLGIFTYSHEEGTHSFSMKDDVPELIKKDRADSIMKLQQKISYDLNQKFIDKKLKVIIDRKEKDTFFGRTEFDSPEVDNEIIIKENSRNLKIGNFYNVIVKEALNYDLYCRLL